MGKTDYRLGECIFDGEQFRILRGHDLASDDPVILKSLKLHYPPPQTVALVRREFEITRLATGDGVIRVREMLERDGQYGLVFEDFGGRPLSDLRLEARPPLRVVLRLAVKLVDALLTIHRSGIVHKNLSPANILWNRETGEVKIIDFGLAQVLNREFVTARPISAVEGTLDYIPPEQTGRMNRVVDHRSDLYALGATLYEVCAGRPPFVATDPLELVHAHLAKRPKPLSEVAPRVPKALSEIVMRLLEKRAEDRYQSAAGLSHDLVSCLRAFDTDGALSPFPLGTQDVDGRLQIPQRLYGREAQSEALRTSFEQAATGRSRLLLIKGYSGIGKTSLVHELYRELPSRRANLVEGKANQYNRGTPYAAILQALRSFVRRVLAEDDATINNWRMRFLQSLGRNAGVLQTLLPEIARLIGPQPVPEVLTPAEARNRFQFVMARFVRAMATMEHPLVLFLDDLQWVDQHSIELITGFATDPQSKFLLFIGAYRSDEVDAAHPIESALAQMREAGAIVSTLELDVLQEADTFQLVHDAVVGAPGAEELARTCHAKTHGNPFFLRRFLESLADAQELRLDAARGVWVWNPDSVKSQSLSENVVDFVAGEIRGLSPNGQRAIEAAACVGDVFDLETLAVGLNSTRREMFAALSETLEAELLAPAKEGFWFASEATDDDALNFTCRFVHDRIRQAARSMIADDAAVEIHLRVGRHLLVRMDEATDDSLLFEVADHLNHAAHVITDHEERKRLRELNHEAGRWAISAAAFVAAHGYYRQAIDLLGEDAWSSHYDETLSIHVEGARAAYLGGDYEHMLQLVRSSANSGQSALDRVRAREVQLHAQVTAQQFSEALQLARVLLHDLGVDLPAEPNDQDIEAALGSTIELLSKQTKEDMLTLKRASGPEIVAALRIQNGVMSSAYLAEPKLLPILACNIVRTTIEHGLCRESPYGFAVVALVFNAINQIELGYSTGLTALELLDRVDDHSVRPRTIHVVNTHVSPFVERLRDTLPRAHQVFQIGMQSGDIEFAAWGLHNGVCQSFYAGLDIPTLSEIFERNLAILQQHKQLHAIGCTVAYGQVIENLVGRAPDATRLVGPRYDEVEQAKALEEINFRGARFILATTATFVRFVFRDLDGAVACADAGGGFADGATSTYHTVWWHQYRALSILGRLRPESAGVEEAIALVRPSIEQLEIWQKASPVNHTHRIRLIEAEIARLEGRRGTVAMEHFEEAIAHARDECFVHEEAIANELAGRYHLSRGGPTAGRAHLEEARRLFSKWGAAGKVEQLDLEFERILAPDLTSSSPTQVGERLGAELDLDSLFKAANLISSETRLDSLLMQILAVAMENAGATRGYLLLEHDGVLHVDAGRDASGANLLVRSQAIEDYKSLPIGIVQHVASSREALVLRDARNDVRFDVVRETSSGPMSVFCAPILHQSTSLGVVYLENELAADLFSPAQLRVLELLITQAAISIENARHAEELRSHRDHLEDLVRDRTTDLDQTLTELREANAVLDKLSTTDALTGLPNRRHFDDTLSAEWRRARRTGSPLCVLMIDVDFFKAYNDLYGHQRGDDSLQLVGKAISSALRRSTDFVARLGGEEFAAVLPMTDHEAAAKIAGRMVEAVYELGVNHAGSAASKFITISVGGAVQVPARDGAPSTLVADADRELYRAKADGRARTSIADPGHPSD